MLPLTKLRATLKQVKIDRLDRHSRELLDGCFPQFLEQQNISRLLQVAGVNFTVTSKGALPTSHGRLRRFAGDQTLPGGRYFSVGNDVHGADGGTLVWELMSYWTARARYFPELIDSTVHLDAARDLRARYPGLGKAEFLLVTASEIENVSWREKGPYIELGAHIAKVLPLNVSICEIDNVIDLRLPVTQKWFADHFGALEVESGKKNEFELRTLKELPSSFKYVLPTLLTPSPGGNAFHQAVGAWLRNNGINGLVYPSARRNGALDSNANTVLSSDGWNFVLYQDAPKVVGPSLFGLQSGWLRERDVGIAIENWTSDETAVRWSLTGPEQGERRRYDLQWEIRMGRRAESVVWESRFGARED